MPQPAPGEVQHVQLADWHGGGGDRDGGGGWHGDRDGGWGWHGDRDGGWGGWHGDRDGR
ncbi:hypothetical protein [Mycobacterium sp. IEC1808]|uniref:hypothetical protein n=1 Tax=Mycobacterium sp. IEC1808 TaxID=1743230 RepID=UPI00187E5E7C|nr:hypothetical protein [Mycobacterium sp. IEC1808]